MEKQNKTSDKKNNMTTEKVKKNSKVISLIDYKLKKELKEAGFELRECLSSNKKLLFRLNKQNQ